MDISINISASGDTKDIALALYEAAIAVEATRVHKILEANGHVLLDVKGFDLSITKI